ncbi:putative proline-rich receptor-like protein kinase PERK3 [Iris pallida]|uniref:Proline-rich receptor-like protein kinase PERK3 n=1 Tax=Iris pallida TaxID=29817 RepID=A0AAX6GA62_IRIPA|nr:putative proline-rich receptor-like protein kinase PERK3 [Iris pallida]
MLLLCNKGVDFSFSTNQKETGESVRKGKRTEIEREGERCSSREWRRTREARDRGGARPTGGDAIGDRRRWLGWPTMEEVATGRGSTPELALGGAFMAGGEMRGSTGAGCRR